MSDDSQNSCKDQIDWSLVNQLHDATLQMSKMCFEFKKIYISVLGVVVAVLIKVTDAKVGWSYFVLPILLTIGFWLADSTTYYF